VGLATLLFFGRRARRIAANIAKLLYEGLDVGEKLGIFAKILK
jgi:hypothetical protein